MIYYILFWIAFAWLADRVMFSIPTHEYMTYKSEGLWSKFEFESYVNDFTRRIPNLHLQDFYVDKRKHLTTVEQEREAYPLTGDNAEDID